MSSVTAASSNNSPARASTALKVFADEASALFRALLSPGTIIREVEQMHALHVEARRVEAADPARAADLRRRASRIGVR